MTNQTTYQEWLSSKRQEDNITGKFAETVVKTITIMSLTHNKHYGIKDMWLNLGEFRNNKKVQECFLITYLEFLLDTLNSEDQDIIYIINEICQMNGMPSLPGTKR